MTASAVVTTAVAFARPIRNDRTPVHAITIPASSSASIRERDAEQRAEPGGAVQRQRFGRSCEIGDGRDGREAGQRRLETAERNRGQTIVPEHQRGDGRREPRRHAVPDIAVDHQNRRREQHGTRNQRQVKQPLGRTIGEPCFRAQDHQPQRMKTVGGITTIERHACAVHDTACGGEVVAGILDHELRHRLGYGDPRKDEHTGEARNRDCRE
jgi:hypothetical protein